MLNRTEMRKQCHTPTNSIPSVCVRDFSSTDMRDMTCLTLLKTQWEVRVDDGYDGQLWLSLGFEDTYIYIFKFTIENEI